MPLRDWKDERGRDSVHPVWLTSLLEHPSRRVFAAGRCASTSKGYLVLRCHYRRPGPLLLLPPPFAAASGAGEVVPAGDDLSRLVGVRRRLLRVGEALLTLPLPLNTDRPVAFDLEETYWRRNGRISTDAVAEGIRSVPTGGVMNTNAFESNDGPPTNPIRLSDPEAGLESEPQYLAAEFQCLVHVDHFQTGGIRDTVAQVIARWREVYNHVTLEVPRPNKGVHRLPFDCPMCGKPVEFRTTSWLRTNLLALCGTILLGLVLAIVGWFNIEAHGKIGVGIAVSGLTLAVGLPLLTLIVPGLLDSIPAALQIVKDVPRDPSRFPIPGSQCPDTTRHSELAASSMNQHKLVKVRLADSAS